MVQFHNARTLGTLWDVKKPTQYLQREGKLMSSWLRTCQPIILMHPVHATIGVVNQNFVLKDQSKDSLEIRRQWNYRWLSWEIAELLNLDFYYLFNEQTITRPRGDTNFIRNHQHSKIKFVFPRGHVICSIFCMRLRPVAQLVEQRTFVRKIEGTWCLFFYCFKFF